MLTSRLAFLLSMDEKHEQAEERQKTVERIVGENWRLLKAIAEFLLRDGGDPSLWPGLHGVVTVPQPAATSRPLAGMRPLPFPNHSLTSIYMGWILRQAKLPDNLAVGLESSAKPSWAYIHVIRLALSTEELFLKVLSQTTQRAKLNRTLQDDCAAVLRTTNQRVTVHNLLRDQNHHLQNFHPEIEWTLAGLEPQPGPPTARSARERSKKRDGRKQTEFAAENRNSKAIEVILKTQWRTPWLGDPLGIGGPVPLEPLGPFGIGPVEGGQAGAEKLWADPAVEGATPSARYGRSLQRERTKPRPDNLSPPHARPHRPSEIKRRKRPFVLQKPQLVLVKTGSNKKARETPGNAKPKRTHPREVYVELRRPGVRPQTRSTSRDGAPQPPTASFPIPPRMDYVPIPPRVPTPGYQPSLVPIPPPQTGRERWEEMEVIEDLFESFGELRDPNGKDRSRRPGIEARLGMRSESDSGIVRGLMQRVERGSQQRMEMEQARIERAKLEARMGESFQTREVPIAIRTRGYSPAPPPRPSFGIQVLTREGALERHRRAERQSSPETQRWDRRQTLEREMRAERVSEPGIQVWESPGRTDSEAIGRHDARNNRRHQVRLEDVTDDDEEDWGRRAR